MYFFDPLNIEDIHNSMCIAAHNAKNLEVDETRIKSFDWNNIAKDFLKKLSSKVN